MLTESGIDVMVLEVGVVLLTAVEDQADHPAAAAEQ